MAFAPSAFAQQPASAVGTGTVTGHITCGDSQAPARFAHVVLYGLPTTVTAYKKPDPEADENAQMAAMAAAFKNLGKTNMVQTQTGTDGNFIATDVAPGDYYLFAAAPGYVSATSQVQALVDAGADLNKPLPGVPVVHVVADRTASGSVAMQRGAAVSGTITWDDGSPLAGAQLSVVPAKGATSPPPQFNMLAMSGILSSLLNISDDEGHFRLSGLAPGDYVVKATIQSGQQSGLGAGMNLSKMLANTPLVVYEPSAFHQADAKTLTLTNGEDLRDQTLILKLGGLHSVSGHINSLETHRGINSAKVDLRDAKDKDFVRSAAVDAQGGFTVTYVPPGTYTLKVSGAEDTEPAKPKAGEKPKLFAQDHTLRSYQGGKMDVVVLDSDLTGQDLSLAVDKNPKKDADFEKMFSDDDAKPSTPPL